MINWFMIVLVSGQYGLGQAQLLVTEHPYETKAQCERAANNLENILGDQLWSASLGKYYKSNVEVVCKPREK